MANTCNWQLQHDKTTNLLIATNVFPVLLLLLLLLLFNYGLKLRPSLLLLLLRLRLLLLLLLLLRLLSAAFGLAAIQRIRSDA